MNTWSSEDDQPRRSTRRTAVVGVAVMLLAVTCASAPVAQAPTARTGVIVVLAIGAPQRVPDSDLTVTFEAVVEDSRCPTGTTCIWAGDAAVKIKMSAPNAAAVSATLHTNLDSAREALYRGARIRLTAVTPAPTSESRPRNEDYRVTLSIERE